MKKIILLFTVILYINGYSQATDFITNLNNPKDLIIYEGTLYITEQDSGKIIRFDLSETDPVEEFILAGVQGLGGMALDGSILYYAQSSSGDGTISKIDLSSTDLSPVVVLDNADSIFDIEIYGTEMYVSQFGQDRVAKFDLTLTNPFLTEVVGNIETAHDMEIIGDDLYVISWAEDKILKINLTNPTPFVENVISNLSLAVGMERRGNELYIAEAGQSIGSDRISKINVTDQNPTRITVVDGLYNPTQGLVSLDNTLYIAENFKISTFEVPPLSIDEHEVSAISVYPNPVSDYFKVSGLIDTTNFKLLNVFGSTIMEGVINENGIIKTNTLSAGVYFISLNNKETIKIIKN